MRIGPRASSGAYSLRSYRLLRSLAPDDSEEPQEGRPFDAQQAAVARAPGGCRDGRRICGSVGAASARHCRVHAECHAADLRLLEPRGHASELVDGAGDEMIVIIGEAVDFNG